MPDLEPAAGERTDELRRRRHRTERIAAGILILVLAGVAAGIVAWRKAETHAITTNYLYIPREQKITPEILMLRDYVRIDSSTPAGEAAGARWIAAELQKRGIRAELIESGPGRLNVYARIKGRTPGEALLLFNHIDVMPPGAKPWQHPPFRGDMAFNQLWARGTLDMKGLAVCQLLAFADVAHGKPPEHDLVFLATADEETGSEYGMRWLIAHRPDVLEGVRYGITEGGLTEMQSEKMTYFGIEVGGKQFVSLTLAGDDRERMQQARIALERFMFPREPERVLPAVRRYLRDLAPTRMAYKPYLADIDRTIADGQFWRLPAPYRDLTQNTLTVTAPVRSGSGWQMEVVQLNLPDEQPAERIAWLERQVAPYGIRIGAVKQQQGPVPISDENTLLFALLRDEARRRYDVVAGMQINYRSTSDARFLRTRGIVCYGVSPYPVDFYQSKTIHSHDERIRLDAFMEGIAYLRSVVAKWTRRTDSTT